MTDLESRCLDAFPSWLRRLADDASAMARLLEEGELPESVRRQVVGSLNYLFKSLDLIPDGIEDLGYIDDAFVFRVAAANALQTGGDVAQVDASGTLSKLAEEADLISDFLTADYARLASFVRGLEGLQVRGRKVDEVLADAASRAQFVGEVKSWASSYQPPSFSRDEKNLVKLKSFMSAKLPA